MVMIIVRIVYRKGFRQGLIARQNSVFVSIIILFFFSFWLNDNGSHPTTVLKGKCNSLSFAFTLWNASQQWPGGPGLTHCGK